MANHAVFPGSFDPITIGHFEVLNKAIPLFDKITIAIGNNSTKKYLFPLEQRMNWIREVFKEADQVEVAAYDGLTVDFCNSIGAKYIIRGLRSNADLDFEMPIAQMNNKLRKDIETVFLITSPEHSSISSTIVRDVIRNGGDVRQFLPPGMSL